MKIYLIRLSRTRLATDALPSDCGVESTKFCFIEHSPIVEKCFELQVRSMGFGSSISDMIASGYPVEDILNFDGFLP